MRPTDLHLLPTLGRPTLSGDGRKVAMVVTHLDPSEDTYHNELLVADTDGSSPPRRLTTGDHDAAPAFSPDGRWLAFLRPGPTGAAQIHLLAMDGQAEPFPVTNHPLGTGQPVWCPDSRLIAYTARVPVPGRYESGRSPRQEAPRRITTLRYLADGFGYTVDRPRQVYVTDPFTPGAAPTAITSGPFDHADVSWSPDASQVTFAAARHETAGDDLRNDIWICSADGTGMRALTNGGLICGTPRFSADGTQVCFAAETLAPGNRAYATNSYGLWSVEVSGTRQPVRLTDERYHLSFASQMIWPGRDGVYFACDHRGEVNLVLVPYDGGEPELVVNGARQVNGYAVAEGDTVTIAAVVASAASAGDLLVVVDGEERLLTSYGDRLVREAGVRPVEEFSAKADDGYPLQGWVIRPEGPGPHPVILFIKGGPFTQWGYTLNGPAAFDDAQMLAGAGYAVVLGNPRGCAGYGQSHGTYVADDLPRKTAPDLLALLDAALAAPDLDADRVGMMGGSFGGYMSAWLAAHHGKHFRAAIGERGLYAIDSYCATSDDGVNVAMALYGQDRSRWADLSPITYAGQIEIPMLFLHSEEDRHCPLEQAQRLYVELKLAGVPTEMLVFPGECHDLSRTGLPSHRLARLEAIFEWWNRHL